jgi:hypothetical protein
MHTRHNTPAADASITVVRPQAQTHTVCCLLLRRSGTYDPPRKQPSHRRKGDKYSGRYAEEQDVDSADEDTMAMRKHHGRKRDSYPRDSDDKQCQGTCQNGVCKPRKYC